MGRPAFHEKSLSGDGGAEGLGILRLRSGKRFALVTAALRMTELWGMTRK